MSFRWPAEFSSSVNVHYEYILLSDETKTSHCNNRAHFLEMRRLKTPQKRRNWGPEIRMLVGEKAQKTTLENRPQTQVKTFSKKAFGIIH